MPVHRHEIVSQMQEFFGRLSEGAERPIDEGANLFELGVLDSLQVVSMVVFIEEQFGCALDYDDLTEENLGTLASISKLVLRKCSLS